MIENNVDIRITDEDVAAAIAKINEARAVLKAFLLVSLTPKQRKAIFKMGKDSIQYVTENYNYAQDPNLRAKGIDTNVWNDDITAFNQLQKIFNVLQPLFFDVYDMMYVTGNEAMDQAQVNYRFLRFLAEEGTPTAQSAYERLKTMRWERKGSKNETPA